MKIPKAVKELSLTFLSCFFISFFCSSIYADELIIEPNAGRNPFLSAIQHAKSSIELVMYGFTDNAFIDELINAKKNKKDVSILLETMPYRAANENIYTINKLQKANVQIFTPDKKFAFIHQKTFLLDHEKAIVMTFNLTHAAFSHERNFALIIDRPAMVKEIEQVFLADRDHKNVSISHSDVVLSPDNSRRKLLDFINNAQTNIKIYAQDITDYQIIGALAKKARAGINIKIIASLKNKKNLRKKLHYLQNAGIIVRNSKKYKMHAKVIIEDNKAVLLGSINLTKSSLDKNRELSVISNDRSVVAQLTRVFNQDWNEANI